MNVLLELSDSIYHKRMDSCQYKDEDWAKLDFDWIGVWTKLSKQVLAIRKEPLAKALGIRGNQTSAIWDLTLGTGKDMLLMLHFGCRVVGFERHPKVILKIHQQMEKARQCSSLWQQLSTRFTFIPCDFREYDGVLDTPDTIYFDPMYPEKKKSALARKEMRIFREVVGFDEDAKETFMAAMSIENVGRVVVKRPSHAPLLQEKPVTSYNGKSTRYDLYQYKST